MFPIFLTNWDYTLAMKYQDGVLEKRHGDALSPLTPLLCPPKGKIPPHIRNAKAAYMFAAADCDMEVIADLRQRLGDIIIVPHPEWDIKGMYWWRADALKRIPLLRLCKGKNCLRQIVGRAKFDPYHCNQTPSMLAARIQALRDSKVLVATIVRKLQVLSVHANISDPRLAWKAGEYGIVHGEGVPPAKEPEDDIFTPKGVAVQAQKEPQADLGPRAQAGDSGGSVTPAAVPEQAHSQPHGVPGTDANPVPLHLAQEHSVSVPAGDAQLGTTEVAPVVEQSGLGVEADRREYSPQDLRHTGEVGSEPSGDGQ